MSEIQKETDEIRSTAGYINMPAGTLYYKTYGKKCDTQGKNGIFYTVHMEDAPVTHVMILI